MRCYGPHSCLDFRGDHGYFILEDYTLKNCEHSEPNGLSAAYTFVTLLQLRFSWWINSFGFGQVYLKRIIPPDGPIITRHISGNRAEQVAIHYIIRYDDI